MTGDFWYVGVMIGENIQEFSKIAFLRTVAISSLSLSNDNCLKDNSEHVLMWA